MSIRRKIICENSKGQRITIGYQKPYWLTSVDGIGSPQFTVYTSKGAYQDGEIYTGTTAEKRNILLSIGICGNFVDNWDYLCSVLRPNDKGTLYYFHGNTVRKINYYLESLSLADSNTVVKAVTASLICPNPFFEALEEQQADLSTWRGNITFPLRLHNPFTVGQKVNSLITNVYNPGDVAVGMKVRMVANASVSNPSLLNVDTGETMRISVDMGIGDQIIVTTHMGNKEVALIRNGQQTEINQYWDYTSTWIQLREGDNVLKYDAESGADNLGVSIYFTPAYWEV